MGAIHDILGIDSRGFRHALVVLEKTLGGASHDVRLLGDISAKLAAIIAGFGLDPRDTTPEELYAVLRRQVSHDNERLAKALGVEQPDNVRQAAPLIIRAMKKQYEGYECFAVKSSSLKKILKQVPPKQLMKAMHYRSIDSMLKHEQTSRIVVLARYTEDNDWSYKYAAAVADLSARDFEVRAIELMWLDKPELADALAGTLPRHHLVLHAKEVGCIAVVPGKTKQIPSFLIRTIGLITHYIQEIMSASTYTKSMLGRSDFGQRLQQSLSDGQDSHITLAGYPLHWRALYGAVHRAKLQEMFPPHISEPDWRQATANNYLSQYNSHITRWADNGYVLMRHKNPVSCNVIDVAIDDSYKLEFGRHSLKFARRELEQELFSRYLSEPRVYNVILRRLGIY